MSRLNDSRTGDVIGGILGDAFGVRASIGTASTLHAQHGVGLFVSLDETIRVTAPDGGQISGRAVMIPPDMINAVHSRGPTLGYLFDPEALPHIARVARERSRPFVLEGPLARRLVAGMAAHRASLSTEDVLRGLALETATALGPAAPAGHDRRVARVVEALRHPDGELDAAIATVGLSRSHLESLFVRDVGVSIRTYRLWRRLIAAVIGYSRRDATAAAHHAGFADLAHFSRTCRRMLGYSPTALRGSLGEVAHDERNAPRRGARVG